MSKLKIEVGKSYKTREGLQARIYATDGESDNPIHGAVLRDNGWELEDWKRDGQYFGTENISDNDLISEWQEPLDFDWDCLPGWADRWISKDDIGGRWHSWREEPDLRLCMGDEFWYNPECPDVRIPKLYEPKNFTGDFKDSLFENPKYKS